MTFFPLALGKMPSLLACPGPLHRHWGIQQHSRMRTKSHTSGYGFTRWVGSYIGEISVDGKPVAEDPAQFEVSHNGDFSVPPRSCRVSAPAKARCGQNAQSAKIAETYPAVSPLLTRVVFHHPLGPERGRRPENGVYGRERTRPSAAAQSTVIPSPRAPSVRMAMEAEVASASIPTRMLAAVSNPRS